MTQYLPSNLLALFAPRDPLPFLPPLDKPTWLRRKPWSYNGVSTYLHVFEDPKDTPPPTRAETREEKLERKKREKDERITRMLEEKLKECKHRTLNKFND
ncbi:U1 small nuclear ribonucleoprotein 70 kDa [Exaiptasia diaphana]|nr:U1 small nuclear ribonucleoprotein 70 kDa [Exaiptasia diaphana]